MASQNDKYEEMRRRLRDELQKVADKIGDDMLLNGIGAKASFEEPVGFLAHKQDVDEWAKKGFPPVLFITYSYDDTEDAPVEDVSPTIERTRFWMKGRSGYVYRAERLPVDQWENPTQPSYGNEQFVETIGSPRINR